MYSDLPDSLVVQNDSKILFLILDGLGGLGNGQGGGTELQVARTPNFDALASKSSCGLLTPIAPGITPGSGPGHFALFGYDPIKTNVGRGVQEAAGIGFPLQNKDVAARFNFATADKDGKIIDRRAGRISTEENERICKNLRQGISLKKGIEVFIETVKEHRGVVVFRGDGLSGDINDTDPQQVGLMPLDPSPTHPGAVQSAEIVKEFVQQANALLRDEGKGNTVLLRGFAKNTGFASLEERFGLEAVAIAMYPMYKGIAHLVGMDVIPDLTTYAAQIGALRDNYDDYDFFFFHIKHTDSRGEDGNFSGKVKVIEEIDELLPDILSLDFDVVVVTGDHSTPARMAGHSWHELPLLICAETSRVDSVVTFDEISCLNGVLGHLYTKDLMTLALAHARRLKKFGA
ncbi:MAG: 2,3-bisphosphoglycerate-independent phosphoglycerate mutase [Deltaproteobacteria bacterium]|nr:2,3-bisphosphoglycerate-independent phosphoglycerate mutase [Deltaproteobacteria bacterium]